MIAREARMRQLATGDKLAIEELTNELLAGLGRPATAADRIAAEILATATVRARRLRESVRSDIEERRLATQLLRASAARRKLRS
jgi:hypothetical protein